ncbi:hypothetical protein ACIPZ8_16455 [Pseudomonas sp. NPDC089422]|uniref:hypothetical protein n=1 Tax=Pseudomonas sp. NPDC089422 TaxID=3364466 RepID=UPI0037FF922B
MTRKRTTQETKEPSNASTTAPSPATDTALLVPPTVLDLVPDAEGAPSNVVDFVATYTPLRVEFPMWAHSAPELGTEHLTLYWNGVEVDSKSFDKPIQPEDLFILAPVKFMIEGEHELHYHVVNYVGEPSTSRPLTIYIDKTPPLLAPGDDKLQFPDFIIREGVTEDYLKANDDKVTATVPPFLGAEPGDSVKWYWSDDPVGEQMVGMIKLTKDDIEILGTQSSSKPLELDFPGAFIRQSGNGTRFARYEVQDRAGTAPQRALARSLLSDPSPPTRELPPPRIKEATGSDFFSTLDPAKALNGVTCVIPNDADIRPGETVTVYWGEPGTLGGYSTSTPTSPGAREYLIPRVHVPPHMNSRVELHYQINKPDVPPSPSHFVTVRKIEGLPIVQCSDIRNGALNLRNLGNSASFTLDGWSFRHTSQFVNAWILGVERGNITREIRLPIATQLPVPTEAGVMTLGSVSKTDLVKLALNYQFRVSVEVSFDDKVSWLKFPDAAAQLVDEA